MSKEDNIGLVTYYKENYGSALQCYATKKFLGNIGYNCKVLYEVVNSNKRYIRRVINVIRHAWRAMCYKGYFSNYISMRKAMSQEKECISEVAVRRIEHFVEEELEPVGYEWKELCKLNDSYVAFIAGSDQIWNASISINSIYFLKFSDKKKRIALAPSFGVANIPDYNFKNIKRGLEGFDTISVREETGEQIVKQYVGKKAVRVADPVMLLTKEEWIEFSKNVEVPNERYIFVHFLNKPSKVALDGIMLLSKKMQCKILCFSYLYEEYESFSDYIIYNGSPKEYVGLLCGAEIVCTDSFHSTLFSIILEKEFYTFHRQYIHKNPQTSRIKDLLARYGIEERLIGDIEQVNRADSRVCKNIQEIVVNERNKLINFLEKEIERVINNDKSICI